MSGTKWLNLQSSEGRRTALCNIMALLRWHISRGSSSHPSDELSADQDDDQSRTDAELQEDASQHSDNSSMDTDE